MELSVNPNLHFGSITIVFNHTLFDNIYKTLFDYEKPNEYSDLIISFNEDNSVMSKMDIKNKEIGFTSNLTSLGLNVPIDFTLNSTTFNALRPNYNTETKQYQLKFNNIFLNYNQNLQNIMEPSQFNCIYYTYDIDKTTNNAIKIPIFSIIKQKYGYDTERYVFAYDHTKLTKDQTAFIIKYIFFQTT